jgi:hypothetical protein
MKGEKKKEEGGLKKVLNFLDRRINGNEGYIASNPFLLMILAKKLIEYNMDVDTFVLDLFKGKEYLAKAVIESPLFLKYIETSLLKDEWDIDTQKMAIVSLFNDSFAEAPNTNVLKERREILKELKLTFTMLEQKQEEEKIVHYIS